jgi:hypothetical protein
VCLPLVAVLVLAGCNGPRIAPEHFLVDGPEDGVVGYGDLLWADFRQLNGSVVLFMEYEDMEGQIPEFTATFRIESGGESQTWFLRDQANRSRPAPSLEYVIGVVEGKDYVVREQVCAITEITHAPWRIRVEAENRITGLVERGGTIKGLAIQTGDFEGKKLDFAETSATFDARSGPNPPDQCPLNKERPE